MSLARNTLRRTLPLATILVLLIGSAARADVQCSQEALASYGPVNQFAFPAYYVDQGGEALEMCFDINDPLCGAIGPVPDPNAPPPAPPARNGRRGGREAVDAADGGGFGPVVPTVLTGPGHLR